MINVTVDCIRTDSFEMDYCSFGNGSQQFVLLPGLSLLPVTPMAKAVAMQYRAFHNGYKVTLFDRKRKIENGYTIEQMAEETAIAMQQLGIKDAYLMGCSQGGMIAQLIAAKHPELVAKLVLCSTAAHPTPEACTVINRWARLAMAGDMPAFNRDVFTHVYSEAYYDKFRQSFELAESLGTPEDVARFLPLARACDGYDSRPLLPLIKCPVLVVGSTIDNVLGGDSSVELSQLLGCKLIMYSEYGHAAYDEAPDLHDHLLEFFQG